MTFEPTLVAKVIEVDRALGAAGIGHAFGGAIALAYCALGDLLGADAHQVAHLDEIIATHPPTKS